MLTIMFVFNVAWSSDSSQKHSMSDDRTKRLLLNDPDVVGARLTNLERTIQDLRKVTVQQAQSISQLQGDLTREQNAISQLQGDLTREKNVISQLQAELRLMKSKQIYKLFAIYCTGVILFVKIQPGLAIPPMLCVTLANVS